MRQFGREGGRTGRVAELDLRYLVICVHVGHAIRDSGKIEL